MDWWTQLVNDIADAFYPDRVKAREAEKRVEEEKIVAKAIKEGEVNLRKFDDQPSIIKEKPKPILKLNVEPAKPKRARTTKGHYRRDDKATANTNEAWVGGKKPKSKKKKK